jgi:FMN reductase
MPSVVVVSGSPSRNSKTARVADYVAHTLAGAGLATEHLRLRDLPPAALLTADTTDPVIARAASTLADAEGVVLATPTYKAAYSGLLKVFLDLLPQFGFAGKIVLPLATGGSLAHVLALDYGLRPVVQSLAPRHVIQSYFLLERDLEVGVSGDLVINPDIEHVFADIVEEFRHSLTTSRPYVRSA